MRLPCQLRAVATVHSLADRLADKSTVIIVLNRDSRDQFEPDAIIKDPAEIINNFGFICQLAPLKVLLSPECMLTHSTRPSPPPPLAPPVSTLNLSSRAATKHSHSYSYTYRGAIYQSGGCSSQSSLSMGKRKVFSHYSRRKREVNPSAKWGELRFGTPTHILQMSGLSLRESRQSLPTFHHQSICTLIQHPCRFCWLCFGCRSHSRPCCCRRRCRRSCLLLATQRQAALIPNR